MRRRELTDRLTAYDSRAAGGTRCGAINAEDSGVILIDPGVLPDELAFIQDDIGPRPVHAIVQTHAHWDHVFGLTTWPDAPRVASAAFERVKEQAAQMLEAVLTGLEAYHGPIQPRPALLEPTRRVAVREPLHPQASGWDIIPVPGHSIDMLALYDTQAHILWAADMLSDREPPMMLPGTTAEYLATLDVLSSLIIETLVPAHGTIARTPGDIQDRFDAEYRYLIELRERVQQAVDAGLTPEETVGACATMRYTNPELYRGAHADNVIITWGELRGLSGYEDEADTSDPFRTGMPIGECPDTLGDKEDDAR